MGAEDSVLGTEDWVLEIEYTILCRLLLSTYCLVTTAYYLMLISNI